MDNCRVGRPQTGSSGASFSEHFGVEWQTNCFDSPQNVVDLAPKVMNRVLAATSAAN
jgi:hypothetical protein